MIISRGVQILLLTKEEELEKKYPIEADYGSKCSLWGEGLRDDVIDIDLYNTAREYYGTRWNYTGD